MSGMGGKQTLTRGTQSVQMLEPKLDDLRNRDLVGPLLTISPLLLFTLYLYLSDRWPQWRSYTDVAALMGVVAVGIVGVWLLPVSRLARGVASPVYAALTIVFAAMWAISFRGGL